MSASWQLVNGLWSLLLLFGLLLTALWVRSGPRAAAGHGVLAPAKRWQPKRHCRLAALLLLLLVSQGRHGTTPYRQEAIMGGAAGAVLDRVCTRQQQ